MTVVRLGHVRDELLDEQERSLKVGLDGDFDVGVGSFQNAEPAGKTGVVDQDSWMANLLLDALRNRAHNLGFAEIGLEVKDPRGIGGRWFPGHGSKVNDDNLDTLVPGQQHLSCVFANAAAGPSDENNLLVEGLPLPGLVARPVVGGPFCEELVGRVGGANKTKGQGSACDLWKVEVARVELDTETVGVSEESGQILDRGVEREEVGGAGNGKGKKLVKGSVPDDSGEAVEVEALVFSTASHVVLSNNSNDNDTE